MSEVCSRSYKNFFLRFLIFADTQIKQQKSENEEKSFIGSAPGSEILRTLVALHCYYFLVTLPSPPYHTYLCYPTQVTLPFLPYLASQLRLP